MIFRKEFHAIKYVLVTIFGCISLFVAANAAGNEPKDSIIKPRQFNVFTQKIKLNFSGDWNLAYRETQDNMSISEFIPATQRLSNWSTLFCVQGFKGLAKQVNPEQFLDAFANQYRQICQSSIKYKKIGSVQVNGKKAYSAIISCSAMPPTHQQGKGKGGNKNEVGYYTVVSNNKDLVLFHKSIRGDVALSSDKQLEMAPLKTIAEISDR